jgi:hypothetical protein
MNCVQFEDIVHDLDRPGTEGFTLRETALGHAEYCSGCARLLTQVESLDLDLRSLTAHESERKASPHLEQFLMDAFRRERAASSRRRMGWQVAALGVAAALFLVLGLSLRYRTGSVFGFSHRPSENSMLTGAGKTAPSSNSVGNVPTAMGSQVTGQQAAQDQSDGSEFAAEFVPLPYADDPAALDGGAVVRVELSQSALASLGLPVANMDNANRVPADLVVSEDGTPQAIRLVSQSNLN